MINYQVTKNGVKWRCVIFMKIRETDLLLTKLLQHGISYEQLMIVGVSIFRAAINNVFKLKFLHPRGVNR